MKKKQEEPLVERTKEAAYATGIYICPDCGAIMKFEDDYGRFLVCENCGFDEEYDDYGREDEDEDDYYGAIPSSLEEHNEMVEWGVLRDSLEDFGPEYLKKKEELKEEHKRINREFRMKNKH